MSRLLNFRNRGVSCQSALSAIPVAGINTGMIHPILARLRALTLYLSDTGHRRFVSTVAAMLATYAVGYALDAEKVALGIEIVLGGLAGGWSPRPSDV